MVKLTRSEFEAGCRVDWQTPQRHMLVSSPLGYSVRSNARKRESAFKLRKRLFEKLYSKYLDDITPIKYVGEYDCYFQGRSLGVVKLGGVA